MEAGWGDQSLWAKVERLLVGSPIPTKHAIHERLTKVKALAVFASDALSSTAYATEEILLILILAGAGALGVSIPIGLAIAALLAIVAVSYYQTIQAYPGGGGAYIVAKDNLGVLPGLTAGAALLIDYVLTVAVSITAGVAAITSALPWLSPFRVAIGIFFIALITLANLRGVRESGTIFAIPTYAFILTFVIMLITGAYRLAVGGPPPPSAGDVPNIVPNQQLALFLILRAFASGCAALTGVEAISNGIPAFKPPEARNAGRTLAAMAAILITLFLGITFLSRAYGVVPRYEHEVAARYGLQLAAGAPGEYETVVSMLARAVFGPSFMYYAIQAATALILLLAANTSFADFPRLSAILARDKFLPRQLANVGDRLVFSNGILLLGLLAAALVVVFKGTTTLLIPLYAVGVFLSFTLSQSGMVMRWRRLRHAGWSWQALVNGVGAAATAVVLLVIAVTKFAYGAWVVILLVPGVVAMFLKVHRHYLAVGEQLSLDGLKPASGVERHRVIVPISGIHRGVIEALDYARRLSGDVTAICINVNQAETDKVIEKWPLWAADVPLVVLPSPYRSILEPLLDYMHKVEAEPGVQITVVVPEFVTKKWWHSLMHNQTARMIQRALAYQHDKVVTQVPYHLAR